MRKIILLLTLLFTFTIKGYSQIEIRSLDNFPDSIVVDETASFGIVIEYTGGTFFYDSIAIRYAVNNDTADAPMNTEYFTLDTLRPINPIGTLSATNFLFSSQYFSPGPDIVIIWPESNSGKLGSSKVDTIKIKKPVGIEELKTNNGNLVIFPIPFGDKLNFYLAGEIELLSVYNGSGKLIFREQKDIAGTINTGNWPSGIYLVESIDSKGILSRKKVLKR